MTADWMTDALCRIDRTFMDFADPQSPAEARACAETCAACPVRQPCLDMGMADPTLQGIYGGLTHLQRQELRRRQGLPLVTRDTCGSSYAWRQHIDRGELPCEPCVAARTEVIDRKNAATRRRRAAS